MRINVLILAFLCSSFGLLIGQNGSFWQETSESLAPTKQSNLTFKNSEEIRYFKLDFKELRSALTAAPKEFDRKSEKLIVSFPLNDGTIERFTVNEAPVMAPALAAKYPNIKSYSGRGVDNPSSTIRFEYTPNGFFGSIHAEDQKIYIEPTETGKMDNVVVFDRKNVLEEDGVELTRFSCGSDMDFLLEPEMANLLESANEETTATRSSNTQVLLRVHRLALACTTDYSRGFGGTLESVNASYVTILNRVNQIFQEEVAVKLELIPTNDRLIFIDTANDPYDNTNCGSCLLGQNRPVFISNGVPDDAYDIGHVFTGGCTDVGGVVSGGMCTDGKMRGVTCVRSIGGAVDILAHEVGHQYSCGHSWDNCPPTIEQRSSGNAMEPGSGSTILSYAGTCGNQNIINGRGDEYYNIGSLRSFINYVKEVQPGCGVDVFNGNNYPTVEIPLEDGFYIPTSTPFALTAIGNDEDGDPITYCWEQTDTESTASSIGDPTGNAPIMRSRPPTSNPTRTFPTLVNALNNIGNATEVLPTYERDLSFTCTVRDNVEDGGGTVWEQVRFKVDGESGPFVLEFPSSLNDGLTAGESVEFLWDPANTQNAPVNCKAVNLMISYDDGLTFADTLGKNVINDGSFFAVVPERVANNARIKIEAADNIFFDFSNSRIRIAEATAPGYTLTIPEFQEICAPANISFDVTTGSVLDFDNPVELSIVGDIPSVVSDASFVNSSLAPGERSSLELAIDNPTDDMTFELTVQAVSQDADTLFRTIQVNVFSTDFSSLSLDGPADGLAGVIGAPEFVWSANSNVISYDFELATSPDFNEESIFASAENLTEPSFALNQILDATTLYYWRVTPTGSCGRGEPSIPSAFNSESTDCEEIAADDLPLTISNSFSGDLQSKINVTKGAIISDINIISITGNHSDFSDLSFSLLSPSGTLVRLVSNKCFAQNTTFDMSFDQESPFDFACPPTNSFIPQESLDAFNGENSEGIWELVVNDRSPQFGGALNSWSLEFCTNIASNPPVLTRNNSLLISNDFEKVIDNNDLRVEDPNNTDREIIFTVVTAPEFGDVLLSGVSLAVGDQFNQADLNNLRISYKSNQTVGTDDNFLFTVIDGEGGFTGTHSYEIEFVEGTVSTSSLNSVDVEVFPNPVRELLFIKTNNNFALDGTMEVYNLQGQLLIQQGIKGIVRESINTAPLGTGIYFLRIQDGQNSSVSKFVVEK